MLVQNKPFSLNKTLLVNGRLMNLSTPRVMGILNVTPDSFFDGQRYTDEVHQLAQVEKMLTEGADFIDVGGNSTRPGAEDISEEEEMRRVVPAVRSISKKFPEAVISVDTFRASVAQKSCEVGAAIINDISAGERDERMVETVASLGVPYIMMHTRGTPQTMMQQTQYENLVREIIDYFHPKIYNLQQAGVKDIIIDPGFGFAKAGGQNFELLSQLDRFHIFEKPVLVGLSRKTMIWKTLKINPEQALNGTTALNTFALLKGVSILRVHDVREAKEIIELLNRLPA